MSRHVQASLAPAGTRGLQMVRWRCRQTCTSACLLDAEKRPVAMNARLLLLNCIPMAQQPSKDGFRG